MRLFQVSLIVDCGLARRYMFKPEKEPHDLHFFLASTDLEVVQIGSPDPEKPVILELPFTHPTARILVNGKETPITELADRPDGCRLGRLRLNSKESYKVEVQD